MDSTLGNSYFMESYWVRMDTYSIITGNPDQSPDTNASDDEGRYLCNVGNRESYARIPFSMSGDTRLYCTNFIAEPRSASGSRESIIIANGLRYNGSSIYYYHQMYEIFNTSASWSYGTTPNH